jgi:glucose/arabinose dehydrogenase
MDYDYDNYMRQCDFMPAGEEGERYLNPSDIIVPPGYQVEVFAQGINFPVNMVFTETGDLLIAESGYITGDARILRLRDNQYELVANGFNVPLSGINYRNGDIYASHRGFVTVIGKDGSRRNILTGLPSNGDFGNNKIEFGPDGKLYFGQGSVTNSGVVGPDNLWVHNYATLCDLPGAYIMLNGQNFETDNMLLYPDVEEKTYTGAFSAYGVPNLPYETRKGLTKATGSILRSNLDGSNLELYIWGLRNAVRLKFDNSGRLIAANQGYDERGSRPIANASDHMYYINQGVWYGYPDYTAGEPVTSPRFTPEGGKPLEFLLTNHPNVAPQPFTRFPPNSNIMGFDINYNQDFGNRGDLYVAEFGSVWPAFLPFAPMNPGAGHRVSQINAITGGLTTFAINRSGFTSAMTQEGGFGSPTDVVFGPDKAMYVLDFGSNTRDNLTEFLPYTGVIWRIYRE